MPILRRAYLNPLMLLALALAVAGGCTRTAYRLKADRDAYSLIYDSSLRTTAPGANYSIDVDPRSRMYDPYDPDHEPMPPDDPAAHEYMHWVDHKEGWKHWHDNGDTPFVENPDWRSYVCLDEDGCLVVSSDEAVQLARLHSRDFQSQLEELYLSALDVSFERFRFDAQFFSNHQLQYTADGPERRGAGGNSSSELLVATNPSTQEGIRMDRMFATGGELVVGLANSLVWEFSGPDMHSATTLANFALVQPLLRGGGKDRVLERLTISERTLLANVRAMQRFERGFYVEIITGEDAGAGPSRRGGVFGGTGLEGFTGVGGGGFGRLTGGGGAGGFTGGAGAAQAGGYLGLLQDLQNIRNQEFNVTSLQNSLLQLEELARANRLSRLQVEQTRQALFDAQSRLLTARTTYESTLDRFKVTLGLPPQQCLKIEDPMLDRFNLISTEMQEAQDEATRFQQLIGDALLALLPREEPAVATLSPEEAQQVDCRNLSERAAELAERDREEAADAAPGAAPDPAAASDAEAALPWSEHIEQRLQGIRQYAERVEQLRAALAGETATLVCADIQKLEAVIPRRLETLSEISQQLEREFNAERGTIAGYAAELEGLPQDLQAQLLRTIHRLDGYQQELEALQDKIETLLTEGLRLTPDELRQRLGTQIGVPLADLLREFSTDVLELALIQARARTEAIELEPVELKEETAIEIARANRRDWANARANLVDAWRLIQFNANDLESRLDVIFEGDIQNVGDNPLNLQSTTGRLRARLEFDAPITRLAERNQYRQALIEYQQARRNFYAFRDLVAQGLRDTLRTIDLNRLNFELRRRAVVIAIRQVDLARLRLQEPPPPGRVGALDPAAPAVVDPGGGQLGDTAARDLVSALSDLLNAQNDFLSVWVNYEVQRRVLDFNLGTMQLNPDGLWVDPGALGSDTGFLLPDDCPDCQLEVELLHTPGGAADEDDRFEELPPGERIDERPSTSRRTAGLRVAGYDASPPAADEHDSEDGPVVRLAVPSGE